MKQNILYVYSSRIFSDSRGHFNLGFSMNMSNCRIYIKMLGFVYRPWMLDFRKDFFLF